MFTYPFQILKRLATTNIPVLREVDFYLNQDSIADKSALIFTAPALYFEFVPVGEIIVHGNRMQSRETDIVLHLITESVVDTGGKRVQKVTDKDHMNIVDAINKFFQGFNAKKSYLPEFSALLDTPQDERIMNSLSRVDSVSPHQIKKSLMKSTHTYRTIIYDHSACKKYQKADPQPSLEVDVELEE